MPNLDLLAKDVFKLATFYGKDNILNLGDISSNIQFINALGTYVRSNKYTEGRKGGGFKMNFANYWAEGVSKSSPNSLVAWDFLKFMTRRAQLESFYEKHKLPSSRKDILATQITDAEIGVFAEAALTAKSVYKKDAGVFDTVFLKMIDDVVLRNFSPTEAIRNATQQINLNLRD